MRNLIITIFTLSLLYSCSDSKTNKYDSFYKILDELLRFNYYDADIVVIDLIKVHKGPMLSPDENGDTTFLPPPAGSIFYSKDMFVEVFHKGLIDSMDINFLFDQIDTLTDFTIDSSKIFKKTLSMTQLNQFFKQFGFDGFYQYLRQKFDAQSFIKISTPLITKDGKKLIFDVEYYCGGGCGYGVTYIFEKANEKWQIIYENRNYIS